MKKLFAIITSFLLICSTSACGASESGEAWKNNTGAINLDTMTVSGGGISAADGVVTITKGGDFEVTGTLADGMIYINSTEKVKLRLSGASITNTTGPAIFFDNAEKGFITITENTENFLTDGSQYTTEGADAALFSNDNLEIKGGGTLTVNGNCKHGIAGDDDVTIENGTININSLEHGIKANDTLTVTGGSITVTSQTGKGMKAGLELIIQDGNINVTSLQDEGIESKGTLTINGGNINITSADDGINTGNADSADTSDAANPDGNTQAPPENGQNGKMRIPPENGQNGEPGTPPENGQGGEMREPRGGRPQGGGTPPQNGQGGGFGKIDDETAAAHAITINGGKIYINAGGDGIDSNGSLTINGGDVIIDGPTDNGNGALDSEGTMSITGGTVILASSAGMLRLPSDGQNTISVFFTQKQSAGTQITIKETQTGNEIVTNAPQKEFEAFVISSGKITEGSEYTIYINGEEYQTVTAVQGTTSAGSASRVFGGGRGGFGRRGAEDAQNPA